MKKLNYFSRFFLWVSGVDDILAYSLPSFERLKLVSFGMAMLIPTILAMVSMFYLSRKYLPEKTPDQIFLLLALFWGFIILIIDRALILGMKKSNIKYSLIFTRLFMAFILGYVISHPLIIGLFNKKITNHIKVSQQAIYREEIDTNNDIENLPIKLSELNANIDVYNTIINNEYSGESGKGTIVVNGKESYIYSSSDGASCGKKCHNLISERSQLEGQRDTLRNRLNIARHEENEFVNKNNDISSESSAMWDLIFIKGDIAFGIDAFFYLMLFMILDILAVMIKVTAPISLYDKLVEDIEREFNHSNIMSEYMQFKEELFFEFIRTKKDKDKYQIIQDNKIKYSNEDSH